MNEPDVNMTDRRAALLQMVVADRVQYDPSAAKYFVDNEEVGNWDRRTLSWLRTVGMIEPDGARPTSRMRVTEWGATHLPVVDSPDQLG